MSEPTLSERPIPASEMVQLVVEAAEPYVPTTKLIVVYRHDGLECRSIGNAVDGVPVPAGSEVVSWEVQA